MIKSIFNACCDMIFEIQWITKTRNSQFIGANKPRKLLLDFRFFKEIFVIIGFRKKVAFRF